MASTSSLSAGEEAAAAAARPMTPRGSRAVAPHPDHVSSLGFLAAAMYVVIGVLFLVDN